MSTNPIFASDTNSFPSKEDVGSDKGSGDSNPLSSQTDVEKNTEPAGTSDIPAEEGIKGWLCVVGAFLTFFCSFGFLNAVGVFQSYYQQNSLRNYSPSEISWIFSFQLMAMWTPGPLIGRVVDTYGPAPILYPCSVLCVFALCMTSLATEYYQIFLAQGVAFGLGSGGIFTSSMICLGQWFVKRRGFATGLAATGSSLGGVIFPLFFDRVIREVGFYGSLRYAALFIGIILAAGCCLIRARLPRKKWDPKAKWFDIKLIKHPQFALLTWGSFFVMWGLWAPFDFITSFGLSKGFAPELSLALISIINATSIFGRIIPPWLADRIGHFNVTAVCSTLTGVSMLALWLPFEFYPSQAGTIVFALVYGLVSGAFVSLLMPCVAKAGPIETIGMRFGTFQTVIGLATLTGLPISGAILARQGEETYWGLQTFAIISAILGGAMIGVSTKLLSKEWKTWKV